MNTFKKINIAFLNLIKESYSPGDQQEYFEVATGEEYDIDITKHVIPVKDIDSKYKDLLKYCEDKGINEIVLDGKAEFKLEINIDEHWHNKRKYEYADVKAFPSYDAKFITFVFNNDQENATLSLNDFSEVVDKTEHEKAFTDLEDMLSPEAKAGEIAFMSDALYDIISDLAAQNQH